MKSRHVMIDLESLAIKPDSVIVSLGAVAFDPNLGITAKFYEAFDLSCQVGRRIDVSTIAWWMKQTEEARKVFQEKTRDIGIALTEFCTFIDMNTVGSKTVQMWGNGSDFDNVLLADLWAWVRSRPVRHDPTQFCPPPLPWEFYNNRCFRTLKNMHHGYQQLAKSVPRVTHHNALDDARWQAQVALLLFSALGIQ